MERPMFNRLSEYTKKEILTEYQLRNIREIESLDSETRSSLHTRIRMELNNMLIDKITDLDNKALDKVTNALQMWNLDNNSIDVAGLTDFCCVLINNYISDYA